MVLDARSRGALGAAVAFSSVGLRLCPWQKYSSCGTDPGAAGMGGGVIGGMVGATSAPIAWFLDPYGPAAGTDTSHSRMVTAPPHPPPPPAPGTGPPVSWCWSLPAVALSRWSLQPALRCRDQSLLTGHDKASGVHKDFLSSSWSLTAFCVRPKSRCLAMPPTPTVCSALTPIPDA